LKNVKEMPEIKRITVANGAEVVSTHSGDLDFMVNRGKDGLRTVTNIAKSRELANIMCFSVGKLCDKGARVIFEATKCQVQVKGDKNNWVTRITGKRDGSLYKIPIDGPSLNVGRHESLHAAIVARPGKWSVPERLGAPPTTKDINLYHRRLGHCGMATLK